MFTSVRRLIVDRALKPQVLDQPLTLLLAAGDADARQPLILGIWPAMLAMALRAR
jgi:hypothetical protein